MDTKEFPTIQRTFTQEMVALYGEVQGDRNMIHYDEAAARAAGFPKPIAHGALVIAALTQACRDYWGSAWFTTGRLAIRLLRPVFVGDTVTVEGKRASAEELDGGERVTFDVWCANERGEKIVAGQASGVLETPHAGP
jgi:3-hydroxybutyryl-CoA dehydratase